MTEIDNETVGNIERGYAEELLAERYSDYSKYVITSRALPDVRDGFKPSQRRVVFGMHVEGNTYDKPFKKSAKSVGKIMGDYHPHGDSSIYSAMVRMGQNWIERLPLIEIHGNAGSIDGDNPAAMRYTEARLARIASEGLLDGIKKKGIVPLTLNFDDTLLEPVVLPVKYPNLLVNGSSGLATGYKTDIPPHNFKETLNGAIALIENPELTEDELMQIIPAPDFPTGGVIVGGHSLKDYYKTGKGRITLRSSYHLEEDKKHNYIILDSIPYGTLKTTLLVDLEKIVNEDKKDKVLGVLASIDESDTKVPVRIKITCDKKANINLILGIIFSKKTSAIQNLAINMVSIIDKKPKYLGVYQMLKAFNDFRFETERKSLAIDKEKLEKNLHIVEGCIKLSDIIDEVVAEIKLATSKLNASKRIQKSFEFTEAQADYIVTMQLHRINKTDKRKNVSDAKELKKLIKNIEVLLSNDKKFNEHIIQQYLYFINDKEFADERRTEIIMEDETWEVSVLDTIPDVDLYVGVSKKGYIKSSTVRSYNTTETVDVIDDDVSLLEVKCTNKDFLVIFTNKCNYLYLPIHKLEEVRWKSTGKHISTIITGLEDGEEVVNAFVINQENDGDKFFFTAKNDGKVKLTKVSEHVVIKKFFNPSVAIKRKDNEELVLAELVEENQGYVGFADTENKTMFFKLEEIAPKGLRTDGMRGIFLKPNEIISKADFSLNKDDLIELGYKEKLRGNKGSK